MMTMMTICSQGACRPRRGISLDNDDGDEDPLFELFRFLKSSWFTESPNNIICSIVAELWSSPIRCWILLVDTVLELFVVVEDSP